MRRWSCWLAWLALVLASCSEVKQVAATQTTVQISIDPEVLAIAQTLHVRTGALERGRWVLRHDKSFPVEPLKWPVEIVIVPRSEAHADESFEVVVEALDAKEQVAAQARARSGFVLRSARTLRLHLSACGGRALGFVCEPDPDCFGPACQACIDAQCVETPFTDPLGLPGPEAVAAAEGGVDASLATDDAAAPQVDANGAGADLDASGGAEAGEPDAQGPVECASGSELDDAGACADIDECARGLDDCAEMPEACMNLGSGLGYSCTCPSGYRGEGRGEDGCTDIDECMERAHQCGMLVTCNNTAGSYSCGSCPPGYAPGTNGDCADIDECATNNGGCDTMPMAACINVVGGPNTCMCPPGYAGDGKGVNGCADVNECATNNGGCDLTPMAMCINETGAPNTCRCPPGYSGDGKGANGCADVNDCTPTSCNGGECIDGVNTISCRCAAPLTGDRCELEICGTVTIRTRMDVTTYARCTEITGNFNLQPDFPDFTASDLPNLRIVRGDFSIGGQMSATAQRATFAALTTIGGRFTFAGMPQGFRELRFPALQTIGSASAPTMMQLLGYLSVLEMPELRNVYGNVLLSNTALCSANFRRVQRVSGDFNSLSDFPHVPYSNLAPLLNAVAGTVSWLDGTPNIPVGCCTFTDQSHCEGYDRSVCVDFTCR